MSIASLCHYLMLNMFLLKSRMCTECALKYWHLKCMHCSWGVAVQKCLMFSPKILILTGKGGFFKVKGNKSTKMVIGERATVPGTSLLSCTEFDHLLAMIQSNSSYTCNSSTYRLSIYFFTQCIKRRNRQQIFDRINIINESIHLIYLRYLPR